MCLLQFFWGWKIVSTVLDIVPTEEEKASKDD